MHFDYTFVNLFGFTLWEPMVAVTNLLMFLIGIFVFQKLKRAGLPYALHMGRFLVLIGIASVFGAVAHGIHHDYGLVVFNAVVYVANAISLMSAYDCFAATEELRKRGKNSTLAGGRLLKGLRAWLLLMLLVTLLWNNFLIVKIHAGVILLYSLVVHARAWRRDADKGSALVVAGYVVSLLSILVHSLHLSLHDYFNHKDLAHTLMIVSMLVIYRGVGVHVAQPLHVHGKAKVF